MSLTPEEAVRMKRMEEGMTNILDFLDFLLPLEISLSELSSACSKSRDTVRKHLITNYKDDVDYYQKIKNGKLYVARAAALEIRKHYVK